MVLYKSTSLWLYGKAFDINFINFEEAEIICKYFPTMKLSHFLNGFSVCLKC